MVVAAVEAVAAMMTLLETSTPTTDPTTWLVNAGSLGVIIILVVTGQLRTKAEVNQLLKQIAEQQAVINAFQAQLTGYTLPALARSAQVLEQLPEVQSTRNEVADLVQKLTEALNANAKGGTDGSH